MDQAQRTQRPIIRDAGAAEILASRWRVGGPGDQAAAAEAALSSIVAAPGLLRCSLFRGVDEPTLVAVLQSANAGPATSPTSADLGAAIRASVPAARLDWQERASPHVSWRPDAARDFGCLVVVRQPLKRPSPRVQSEWVDAVIAALESDVEPNPDLHAATFFFAVDGAHVLNLAEWSSAEAHRAALGRGAVGQHGSIGATARWRAARGHPGITPEHEVGRYTFIGAVEPEG